MADTPKKESAEEAAKRRKEEEIRKLIDEMKRDVTQTGERRSKHYGKDERG